jgi:plasmid stabilization system protein ParE
MDNGLRFHPGAVEEYLGAIGWYREKNPIVAGKFVQEISGAVLVILKSPRRWPVHLHGTRKFVLRHFPFAIVYRELSSGTVQIVAIAHGHRQPGYWRNRKNF